ncbi:MAG: hypothetical protein AABY26_01845 [Nanoarchaeota archaeon]
MEEKETKGKVCILDGFVGWVTPKGERVASSTTLEEAIRLIKTDGSKTEGEKKSTPSDYRPVRIAYALKEAGYEPVFVSETSEDASELEGAVAILGHTSDIQGIYAKTFIHSQLFKYVKEQYALFKREEVSVPIIGYTGGSDSEDYFCHALDAICIHFEGEPTQLGTLIEVLGQYVARTREEPKVEESSHTEMTCAKIECSVN